MAQVELIAVGDVAKELHWTHRKVIQAILNRTLPIGTAVAPEEGEHFQARIPKARWEAWKNAKDLGAQSHS